MVRPQRADARRNRDRLVEVASDAFAEHGVDTSLEEIARRAGVGIGTLYRHFPSRDALLEAVFRRNVDQLADGATQLLETMPPADALAAWMQRFVAYVATKKGLAAHLKTVVSADSDVFAYSHLRMHETIRHLVESAVAAGEIRGDIDAADLLRALSGVCLMADNPGWQEQACRVSGLLMDGLRYPTREPHATTSATGSSDGAARRRR